MNKFDKNSFLGSWLNIVQFKTIQNIKEKFPFYTQLDVMDCGPACLRMIAKFYGRHYSLQTLRDRSFITREGVSMLGISDAAESVGMRTAGIKISTEKLVEEAILPCILHWHQNHFVVLYKVKRNRKGKLFFFIADPASRLVCYGQKEFTPIRFKKRSFMSFLNRIEVQKKSHYRNGE